MNARRYLVLGTLLACLGFASAASAELTAFMRVKAAKQGDIRGGVTQKGREGSMAIVALDHLMLTPTDAATGMSTGKRQHKPLVVTKAIDRASPSLRTAMINNENLTEVKIQFWQPAPTGAETQHFTIVLTNARIVSIEHTMLDNRVPENTRIPASEKISFSYERISWTWTDGGIEAEDTWRTTQ